MTTTPDPVSEVMALADAWRNTVAGYLMADVKSTTEGDFESMLRAAESARTALESRVRELERDAATCRDALRQIKTLVVGDAFPNWHLGEHTYASRGRIADICDAAIDSARGAGEVKGETP